MKATDWFYSQSFHANVPATLPHRAVTTDDLFACVKSIREGDEWSPEYASIVMAAYDAICAAFPGRPQVQRIYGIPFGPDPKHPHLADWAKCQLCGQVVDVGGELKEHVDYHRDLQREMDEANR